MAAPPKYVLRGAAAANDLRLEEGLGLEPIVDLWGFIRGLGVDLAFHDFGDGGGDGVYYWNGDRGLIVINPARKPVARQRFTAAHELGHHVLHRKEGQPLEAVDEDVLQADSSEEKEANAFAARLLAPDAAMRAAFPGTPDVEIAPEDVADLMHRFGITFQAAVYRLHNAGRILAATRDRLRDEAYGQVEWILQVKGYEKEDLAPGSDLPSWYVLRVLEMTRRGAIESRRAAELLRTTPDSVSRLIEPVDEKDVDTALADAFGEDFEAALSTAARDDEAGGQ